MARSVASGFIFRKKDLSSNSKTVTSEFMLRGGHVVLQGIKFNMNPFAFIGPMLCRLSAGESKTFLILRLENPFRKTNICVVRIVKPVGNPSVTELSRLL